MGATRVLGIDPGSVITGWGIVESGGNRLVHIDNGGIFTRNKEFHQRLVEIFDGLQEVVSTYKPDMVSMEQVFVSKNAQSALKLGHARGVASIVALKAGLVIHEYTPMQIKLAVSGHGRASKEQVGQMVQAMLGLPEPAQVDASDALGAAICHILQPKDEISALLAQQKKPSRRRKRRGNPLQQARR